MVSEFETLSLLRDQSFVERGQSIIDPLKILRR